MVKRLHEIQGLIAEGNLRLGMTREEVRSLLGTPDDVGCTSRKYPYPACWKFGDVEFHWPPARSAAKAQADGLDLVMVDGWEGGPDPIVLLQATL